MSRALSTLLVIAAISAQLGCNTDADSPGSDTSDAENQQPSSQVDVVVASWEEVQGMVAKHQGKVVVVDLWSTYCAPCIREFPNLVKLQEAYPDRVACISVCLNYTGSKTRPPESYREPVSEFLRKQNAQFENVICSDSDLSLYDTIKLSSIPAVFVYDRQGEMVRRFDNEEERFGDEGFSYEEHVNPLVEQLFD